MTNSTLPSSHLSRTAWRYFSAVAVAVLTLLSGCASAPTAGASYSESTPAIDAALAPEAVDALLALFPPASTEFSLLHASAKTAEGFGARLNAELRQVGYAVQDGSAKTTPAPQEAQFPLTYVVDQPVPGLYRLSLAAGGLTLSRAYRVRGNEVGPAGAWVRRLPEGVSEAEPFAPVARHRIQTNVVVAAAAPATPVATPQPVAAPTPVAPPQLVATAVPAAVASPAAEAAATTKAPSVWPIKDEKTLRAILDRWTALGTVRLQWESSRDLPISDDARKTSYSGSLRQAIAALASQLGDVAAPPLGIRFIDNGAAVRVYDLEDAS